MSFSAHASYADLVKALGMVGGDKAIEHILSFSDRAPYSDLVLALGAASNNS